MNRRELLKLLSLSPVIPATTTTTTIEQHHNSPIVCPCCGKEVIHWETKIVETTGLYATDRTYAPVGYLYYHANPDYPRDKRAIICEESIAKVVQRDKPTYWVQDGTIITEVERNRARRERQKRERSN